MKQHGDWKAFLVETTTGVIGPEVSLREGSDFSLSLASDSVSEFSLEKTDLPKEDLNRWLDSWWSSILITFEGRAIFCGPIISNPREYIDHIQFNCGSVRSILTGRYVITEEAIRSTSMAKAVIKYDGLSLGAIAQEVVKLALEKPGGNIPMQYVSPYETVENNADHQRTYKGYNLSTLSVDEVLTKISEVSKGPDIMFRPRLIDDNSFTWEMHHGTKNDPRISQKVIPEFDLTTAKGQSASLEITKTGTYLTDRVFSLGGGTNEATVMSVAQDLSKTSQGYPLRESVVTVSDSTNKTVVNNHAVSSLKQNRKPLTEFTLFVDVRGPYPLGSFWPGDLVKIYSEGFYNLPDGENKMRLLNISGSFGSGKIRLSLQLDDQWIS